MKILLPFLALVVAAPASADDPENADVPPEAEAAFRSLAEGDAAPLRSGLVVNPDVKCEDQLVVAEGRDGEAEFRRMPGGGAKVPMHYAVDIQVDGCDVMLAMSGELRRLPDVPEDPRLIPAEPKIIPAP